MSKQLSRWTHCLLLGLVLVSFFALVGCSSFWVTPTPNPDISVVTPTPTPGRSAERPTRAPTLTPAPAATPAALTLTVSDADLQFWSNPNEIVDLLWDGETVWAATLGGVVRWWPDGGSVLFTTENGLASQAVAAIARDADGHIWIGYRDAPQWSEYDGATWVHYPTRQDAVEARYEAMLAVHTAHPLLWSSRVDSDWVWLPRGNGNAQVYDGERWRSYAESHGVTPGSWGVTLSSAGRVWAVGQGVATALEGELWWDDHALFSGIASPDWVTDLAVDANGGAWVSFVGERDIEGGIAHYNFDLDRWEGYQHEVNEAIPEQVYCLSIDADGTILAGGNGVIAVRPPQRAWRSISAPGVDILALARGEDDVLWLGSSDGLWSIHTDGTGLRGPFTIPTPLRDNEVRSLLVTPQDELLLVGPRGISLVRQSGEIERIDVEGLRAAVPADGGQVWLGGDTGLYRLDPQTKALTALSGATIADLASSADGLVLLGADGGVYRWQDRQLVTLLAAQDGRLGTGPRNVTVDDAGTIWLSSPVGLGMLTPDGNLDVLTDDDGLLSADVRAVVVDTEGVVWCATAMGLARRRTDGSWTRFTVESTGGGLRALSMRTLAVEADGTLWMATDAGLSCRSPEADWSYYDLPGIDQIAIDAEGIIWLGSESGLYRLHPEALLPAEE